MTVGRLQWCTPPLHTCTSVLVKMVTSKQEAFCVLCSEVCESVTAMQREFHQQYGVEPPTTQRFDIGTNSSQTQVVCANGNQQTVLMFLTKM